MTVDLNEMCIFHRVVLEGSFTRAAASLELPKSTVSERVSRLEARLGVRLLERTTRKLRTTDAGKHYFDRAARIVAEAHEADATVVELAASPRGLIRICAQQVAAHAFLSDVVCEFLQLHPHVEIELQAVDRRIDLIEEGFDIGIHVIGPLEPTWVARRLGDTNRIFVASPAYLAAHGKPRAPEDLDRHSLIAVGTERRTRWRFEHAGKAREREIHARYAVTSLELALDAALRGVGICPAPMILAGELLRDKRLVRVLPTHSAGMSGIWLVYPSGRHLSNRVRLFAELVRERFTEIPIHALRGGA